MKNLNKEVKLNENEFVAWTITDSCGIPVNIDANLVFKTKKEAAEYRKSAWADCYKSEAEMDRELQIKQYVFSGNTTVCPVEDRIEESVYLTEDDFDKEVLCTYECDWGNTDLVLLTRPDLDTGVLIFDGLSITNCPKNKEEIDPYLVENAISCFLGVYNNYMNVGFNYPTIEEDMKECWESCY